MEEFLNQSPHDQMLERLGLEPHIMGLECCYGKNKNKKSSTGGGTKDKDKKLKTITPGMTMKEKAEVRNHNFKQTGVQTHGGTRTNYSKKEAAKIGAAVSADNKAGGTASFASVTRGAKNPLNRAPSTAGVKVGPMKSEFTTPLGGVNYSQFAAPKVNYNFNQRSPSDISFSNAIRGGARFNEAGRNELSGGKNVAMLGGDSNLLGIGSVIGAGLALPSLIKGAYEKGNELRQNIENRLNPEAEGDQSSIYSAPGTLVSGTNLQGLAPKTVVGSEVGFDRDSFNAALEGNYDPDSTAGGLNIGNNFQLSAEEGNRLARALTDGPSPRMLSEGGDLRFSDMYEAAGPGATITKGINAVKNRIPLVNMLPDMKINTVAEEAQRRYLGYNPNLPASALARMDRRGGGGGTNVPVAPTVAQEVAPQYQPVPSASTTPTTQTGVDPNRLLQIQQQAYAQAYNPMLIGGFNPQFRFGGATPTIDYSTYFNY